MWNALLHPDVMYLHEEEMCGACSKYYIDTTFPLEMEKDHLGGLAVHG
jgi:hypothetical protein